MHDTTTYVPMSTSVRQWMTPSPILFCNSSCQSLMVHLNWPGSWTCWNIVHLWDSYVGMSHMMHNPNLGDWIRVLRSYRVLVQIYFGEMLVWKVWSARGWWEGTMVLEMDTRWQCRWWWHLRGNDTVYAIVSLMAPPWRRFAFLTLAVAVY